jgi:hypothetical protein
MVPEKSIMITEKSGRSDGPPSEPGAAAVRVDPAWLANGLSLRLGRVTGHNLKPDSAGVMMSDSGSTRR